MSQTVTKQEKVRERNSALNPHMILSFSSHAMANTVGRRGKQYDNERMLTPQQDPSTIFPQISSVPKHHPILFERHPRFLIGYFNLSLTGHLASVTSSEPIQPKSHWWGQKGSRTSTSDWVGRNLGSYSAPNAAQNAIEDETSYFDDELCRRKWVFESGF
ncbi:predicted protein [Histoplasma capsulatum G186AR]|uniref:Uncharacterized protein n=1 Tax=Ajellomyces capsulatus (strain G186AR / H82 / ATCC MYA-2454 / RMSCC 2432) TaxID=447093 RepID=C0NWJ3_AJECG|nr:uncharacterized protein HCBG_07523 [Histoplasma capsulatum G186AR]EEH04298.1 predicted protein [Histoplasma capsulatum G186AR]